MERKVLIAKRLRLGALLRLRKAGDEESLFCKYVAYSKSVVWEYIFEEIFFGFTMLPNSNTKKVRCLLS